MLSRISHVLLIATLWTVAHQASLSVGFSRQEYCSGLLVPSPGDLPDSRTEPWSPALQADSLPSEPPGRPLFKIEPYLNIQLHVSLSLDPTMPPCLLLWTRHPDKRLRVIKQAWIASQHHNFSPETIVSWFWECYSWGICPVALQFPSVLYQILERLFARALYCVYSFVNEFKPLLLSFFPKGHHCKFWECPGYSIKGLLFSSLPFSSGDP